MIIFRKPQKDVETPNAWSGSVVAPLAGSGAKPRPNVGAFCTPETVFGKQSVIECC